MDKTTLQIVISAKDEVTKELQKTKKELKKVSDELKKMQTTAGTASRKTKNELNKVGKEAVNVRGTVKKLIGTFQGLGALRLFGAIGALLALRKAMQLVRSAMFTAAEFESVMSNINTLFDDTGESVAKLEEGIKDMVKSMPVDPKELGSAAYQIVSAGISDTTEALKVLEASGKLAVAGLSTTAESADILTSAINAFSKDGLTAAEISNVLFKTVKAGKTTIAELAQAFGATAPIVAEIGVKFKDFQAATAALTTTGLPAAQAQNALRGAIAGLLKPSGEMEKLFEKIGVKSGRELIETTENLGEAFTKLRDAALQHNISIEEAFGRIEGLNAVFGLTGSVAGAYADTLKAVQSETDLLTEGFLKQQKTMTAQWQLVKNQVNVAMVELGSKVFPIVLGAINSVIDAIANLNKFFKNNIIQIEAVTKSVIALTGAIIILRNQILILSSITAIKTFFVVLSTSIVGTTAVTGSLSLAIGVLQASLLRLLGPVGWVIAGLTAIAGVISVSVVNKINKETRAIQEQGNAYAEQAKQLRDARIEREKIAKEAGDEEEIRVAALQVDEKEAERKINALLNIVEKANQGIARFSEELQDARNRGIEAIVTLQQEGSKRFEKISESIRAVSKDMTSLLNEFDRAQATDVRGVANAFAQAEVRVKKLKEQLIRATDIQQIFDIKTQIKEEEDALARTAGVREEFSEQIAEAQKTAGLSELERAIANFRTKRDIAEQEFNAKKSDLEEEKRLLVEKRELEQTLNEQAIAMARTELEFKLQGIRTEKTEFEKAVKTELDLEQGKITKLELLIGGLEKFRQDATSATSKIVQSAIQAEIDIYNRLASAIAKVSGAGASVAQTVANVQSAVFGPVQNVVQGLGNVTPPFAFSSIGGASTPAINVNVSGTFLSEEAAEKMGDLIIDKLKTNIRM